MSRPLALSLSLIHIFSQLNGLLVGTACGDALGLPTEGLSRQRIQRIVQGIWRHRLFWGRGMISDDTEHTVFVAQSLLRFPDSPSRFAYRLSWCLRGWLDVYKRQPLSSTTNAVRMFFGSSSTCGFASIAGIFFSTGLG